MPLTPDLVVMIFFGLFALLLARAFERRITAIARQVATVSRIEAKLDLLLAQAGLKYDPYKDAPAAVVDALKRGRKIEAIKRYREANPVSLKDAKEYVEGVQRRAGLI
jgi:ribosomal protein L7/L12